MTRPTTTRVVAPPAAAVEALWGSVLPIPAGPRVGDDFEARVRRTWEQIKAGYFAAEEHVRLREVLRELFDSEAKSNG